VKRVRYRMVGVRRNGCREGCAEAAVVVVGKTRVGGEGWWMAGECVNAVLEM
jgi:xanthine dehydrogenase iron-sulfur cluster and FAD-binding subunit A